MPYFFPGQHTWGKDSPICSQQNCVEKREEQWRRFLSLSLWAWSCKNTMEGWRGHWLLLIQTQRQWQLLKSLMHNFIPYLLLTSCFSSLTGSLCRNFVTQCYQLPVMDTVFVRKCHRGQGHAIKILEDFVGSFRNEYIGLKYPLSEAMYKGIEAGLQSGQMSHFPI